MLFDQAKAKKYQESESRYQHNYRIWENQVSAIQGACEKKILDAISSEKEPLISNIESKYSPQITQLSQKLETLEQEKYKTESSLKILGLFAFSEKRNAKERISVLTVQIEEIAQQLEKVKQEYNSEKENIASWEASRREQLLTSLKDEYPLPPAPEREPILLDDGTTISAAQLKSECITALIMDTMTPGVFYDRNDLIKIVSSFEKVNIQYIAAISNTMVDRGYLVRVVNDGIIYFGLR